MRRVWWCKGDRFSLIGGELKKDERKRKIGVKVEKVECKQ